MSNSQPSIFVSYAHEDGDLARVLASAMEDSGARVWLDQGELLIGDSLIERITEAIAQFDFVAALVSHASVESNWCKKEIALAMTKQLKRGARRVTVLPLRVGDVAMPASLVDVKWIDLDRNHVSGCAVQVVSDARRHLEKVNEKPLQARTVVKPKPAGPAIGVTPELHEPVRLTGVDTANVSGPRNDGTRGSALYRIPLLLNRIPHRLWADAFPEAWNHPPAFTTMHRPGIASVQGDRIVLDGTTIEEVEKYHLTTLKLVIADLNRLVGEQLVREQTAREAAAEHNRQIAETAARLDFDQ